MEPSRLCGIPDNGVLDFLFAFYGTGEVLGWMRQSFNELQCVFGIPALVTFAVLWTLDVKAFFLVTEFYRPDLSLIQIIQQ